MEWLRWLFIDIILFHLMAAMIALSCLTGAVVIVVEMVREYIHDMRYGSR